jgi:hypothetical protein
MAMATLRIPALPRLPLLRSQLRPGGPTAEGHLHFDRAARVWRNHEELDVQRVAVALSECA